MADQHPTPEWEDAAKWGEEMHAEEHIRTFEHFFKYSMWGFTSIMVLLGIMALTLV